MLTNEEKIKILSFGGYRISDYGEKFEEEILIKCFYPNGAFGYGLPDLNDLNILMEIIQNKCAVWEIISNDIIRVNICGIGQKETISAKSKNLVEAIQNALLQLAEQN
jgi:hypothetical protein